MNFVNLTNGIEAIPKLHEYSFIRIQSTACEQKRWDAIILDLDANFLMALAMGKHCVIWDYSNKRVVPRAIWQGVEFIKVALYEDWFCRPYEPVHRSMAQYFKTIRLDKAARTKLKYYRKFLLIDDIHLEVRAGQTTHDGNYAYYRGILEGCL